MNPLLVALGINLLALMLLALRFVSLRREVATLRARSEALTQAPPVPPELIQMARNGAAMLSIRILNPMELAAQKHWLAGMAGRITPGIVRKVVCHEAAKIVSQELPKYGVVAEVKVVGGSA